MRLRAIVPLAAALLLGAAPRPLTLFLAGDSTMAQKLAEKRPETGWGEALQQYFDIDQVRVENHARNGRSTRTFLEEGRWQAILDRMQPGDWVLVQFGHNDESKEKTDRYTPPDDFKRNLARMVDDVRARKGNPLLATPVRRRKFDAEGKLVDTHGEYPDLVRAVAKEKAVPLLDMHERSAAILERFGPEGSRKLFLQVKPGEHPNYPNGVGDNTHFSPLGAELIARAAADGIRDLGVGLSKLVRVPAAALPGPGPASAVRRPAPPVATGNAP